MFIHGKLGADTGTSTRIVSPNQHARSDPGGYPYREKSGYILQELDLKSGDVVVDIGAGDGWWAEKMAHSVGEKGVVYAAEIDQIDVARMEEAFANMTQIKPYLCETDSTLLAVDSCDLAFLSQTYHHLDADTRVDYLRHLRKVIKPLGRVCVVEKYATIGTHDKVHGTSLSNAVQEAEEAGWIPVRCELITGTQYFIAIFVQKDLFRQPKPTPKKRRPLLGRRRG